MNKFTTILLTLILIALAIIGYILYNDVYNSNINPQDNELSTVSEDGVGEDANKSAGDEILIDEDTNESTMSENVKNDATGSVSGSLCYPSEGIPPLNVYVKNTETDEIILLETDSNESEYLIENVPVGSYIAYAYVMGLDEDYGGGYTEAVTCGLSVECEDHTPIVFDVLEDDKSIGVDICDWYGADIPSQTMVDEQ